jgi:hypothetical protein
MTKEKYFEMCEMLNQEPVESEIPIELDDFPSIVQQCFSIYSVLTDVWDPMGGNYLGKDYSLVFDLFELYSIEKEDRLLGLQILQFMDTVRSKLVAEKIKNQAPSA